MSFLIIILFGFLLMWLLVVLPQRRRQNAQNAMLAALEPGDEVVTAGGMYGTITDVDEEDVLVEVAPEVEVRVAKRAIAAVVPPEDDEEEGELEELEDSALAAENDSSASEAENESVPESRG